MNQPTYLTVCSCAKTGQGFWTVLSVAGHSPFITEQNLATRFLLNFNDLHATLGEIFDGMLLKDDLPCFSCFKELDDGTILTGNPYIWGFRLRCSLKPIHFFLFFSSRSPARICDRGEFGSPVGRYWPESRWRFRGFFFDELWILG